MSEGQSFYLVLVAFYLLECITFGHPESLAMVSRFGRKGAFFPRRSFLIARGIRKALYLGPWLPAPSVICVASGISEKAHAEKRVKTASGVHRQLAFLVRVTRALRWMSALCFLFFFVALPYLYINVESELAILGAVGASYLFLASMAVHLYILHRRIFPKSKLERLKAVLYTALLPWHAMRCADEFLERGAQEWSSLALLAANAGQPLSLAALRRLWRSARFEARPAYSLETMKQVLDGARIDWRKWDAEPVYFESPQYCPCCHDEYEATARFCSECREVALVKAPKNP